MQNMSIVDANTADLMLIHFSVYYDNLFGECPDKKIDKVLPV